MAPTETEASPAGLPTGRFSGPAEFSAVIRAALAEAARAGWVEMVWSDPHFEDWPLRERAVVQSLQAWARPGRRLVLLAQSFESMRRCHPLFVEWRIRWGHLIDCRKCSLFEGGDIPSALVGPGWAMRRLDLTRSSGVASLEARWRAELRSAQESCRRQSTPGFPASTLGL
jgi:hypothetical protein